jgi:hypothetical protein
MNGHLSSQQIDGWLIGERTREVETHMRVCGVCFARVRESKEPLERFSGAVRNWAVEVDGAPVALRPQHSSAGLRWGLAVTALLIMIAAPVYHQESAKRRAAAAAATAAQDEILLREVQTGLSRTVPAPLEPLAKLMWNQ